MRKRTIALLGLLAALAGAAVSRAYLFTVRQATAENVITFGSLQMRLRETDEKGADVTGDPTLHLSFIPSQEVTRVITVENVCQEGMFLRMRLSISGTSAGGEEFTLSDAEAEYAANTSGGWLAGGDGWYYYEEVLTPGAVTGSLLRDDLLLFHTDEIIRTHPNELLTLSVEVQAVQSKHNGTDVRAAQGWPEEVGNP